MKRGIHRAARSTVHAHAPPRGRQARDGFVPAVRQSMHVAPDRLFTDSRSLGPHTETHANLRTHTECVWKTIRSGVFHGGTFQLMQGAVRADFSGRAPRK
ncbi:ABC transporter [Burkholderia pseudomallei]|nr:ABC transporter [Burkholderia pseudomallei]